MTGLRNTLMGFFMAALSVGEGMLPAYAAQDGEKITVSGEFIDTWCYFSGVMGSQDAVVGSAHHTCAMWCSAGGIPVGILTEDGTVYMVLKVGEDATSNGSDNLLSMASDTVTADGTFYARDGINYIVVSKIVQNDGITRLNHEDLGVVPDFAIQNPNK